MGLGLLLLCVVRNTAIYGLQAVCMPVGCLCKIKELRAV